MELLTAQECNLIQIIRMMSRPKPLSAIEWGPDSVTIGSYKISRESLPWVGNGERPRVTVQRDGIEIGTGSEVCASILGRVGEANLDNRMNSVLQKATYDLWGGEEEYYKIFFWLKDGKTHSDLDSVDKTCFDCGIRGIPVGQSLCSACSIAR
jgi:hypothetical protein